MSYLDRICENNNYISEDKIPLFVDNLRVGQVRKEFIELLLSHDAFVLNKSHITLNSLYKSFDERTQILSDFAKMCAQKGVTDYFMSENYPLISKSAQKPLAFIDRSISTLLGTLSFGQHLNGYVRSGSEIKMWIAKRALDKPYFPGKLDHLVAGGLPYDITPQENIIKECYEEAGVGRELALKAKSVGLVSYRYEYELGGKEDIVYCYDLELDANFTPNCTDGEVEEFYLLPLQEIAQIVRDTNKFKPNCNLVIIDFLVRHSYITPEEKEYIQIVQSLRQ